MSRLLFAPSITTESFPSLPPLCQFSRSLLSSPAKWTHERSFGAVWPLTFWRRSSPNLKEKESEKERRTVELDDWTSCFLSQHVSNMGATEGRKKERHFLLSLFQVNLLSGTLRYICIPSFFNCCYFRNTTGTLTSRCKDGVCVWVTLAFCFFSWSSPRVWSAMIDWLFLFLIC